MLQMLEPTKLELLTEDASTTTATGTVAASDQDPTILCHIR